MGVFSRSWELTKMSFRVIKLDREMLLFPLLAGIFSLLFSATLLFPTILLEIIRSSGDSVALSVVDYALIFVSYLGMAFIATFFNVCVVFTTKTRFEGGDATFMDSIKFAFSKIHLIFAWSLVSATVGLLLRALDQAAQRAGTVGRILLGILSTILGMTWSIVTIFVIPAMVYDDLGPMEAIKKSTATLRRTWGESLIRHFGLGLIQFLFMLLGVALAVLLFGTLGGMGGTGLAIAIGLTVIYFLAVILIFTVANNVYNTALYAYANGS
ncbi:MAG: hypothetical protein DRI90_19850, partial [Deltaproteobacteria bacterium]